MTKTDGAVLKATGLSKSYRLGELTIPALRDVDLTVRQGEFLAVMGPSGSGKSTLLHLLGLLDVPDSGEVEIAGERTATLDDDALTGIRRSKLGFLFQSFELIPNLSARENVLLPAEIAGRGAAATGRLAELADALGIADRLDHRPRQLSGGQRQRVALARALINEPLVVLADEPTGNLDTHTGAEVLELLRRGVDQFGWTVVMVTHDPNAAMHADRIVFLRDGGVSGEASTHEGDPRQAIERFVGV
ncbi:MAG TPA: ABC transporter ATP-binding protein [Trueperaceae bacterium]|nr:ABC transporter ATP-binding protein [Trueperaceae bacterium]